MSKKILILTYSLGIYLLLLWWHGYEFGGNDQIEILPYALKINQPSLFTNDFHLSLLLKTAPNERTFVALILAFGGSHLELWTFVLHAFCSITLIFGLYRIFEQSTDNQYVILFSILFLLVPMYVLNLGGNDIYYNQFTASNLAKAMVVWAFYCALRRYFVNAALLISAATLIQPIAGVQAFLLVSAMILGTAFFEKNIKNSFRFYENGVLGFTGFLALYGICCGFYLFLLFSNYGNDQIDANVLYHFFEFRLPHHFIPTAFGLKNYLILVPLFMIALWRYWQQKHDFFLVYVMSMLGCLVYFVAVVFMHNTLIFSTQWFKTTIWLKAFLPHQFAVFMDKIGIPKYMKHGFWAFVTSIIVLGFFKHQPYQFPFWQQKNLEKEIALAANDILPSDALVMNYGSTAFKYYAQKSEYFNYKSVVHRKDGISAWLARYDETYPLESLNKDRLQHFKAIGITHIVMPVGKVDLTNEAVKILLINENWCLYELL